MNIVLDIKDMMIITTETITEDVKIHYTMDVIHIIVIATGTISLNHVINMTRDILHKTGKLRGLVGKYYLW